MITQIGRIVTTQIHSTSTRTRLNLPDRLGTIEDTEGLRRHALVARQAGAGYAVINPESGTTEAISIEEFTG